LVKKRDLPLARGKLVKKQNFCIGLQFSELQLYAPRVNAADHQAHKRCKQKFEAYGWYYSIKL
jgi:hypothetical protein